MDCTNRPPNEEQIRYWNDTAGQKWVALQEKIDAQIAPLGLLAIERSGAKTGEVVIDVGCGCGQTALQLAQRVGPRGRVVGVDISEPMLARARERSREHGLDNIDFVPADAQTHSFPAEDADLVFSRFGVMFFADPVAAFANLRQALTPDGRLTFVCWQGLFDNPWMLTPLTAAAEHLPLPAPPAPGSPGPFAFADRRRVTDMLEDAGFTDVEHESVQRDIRVGASNDLDEIVDFMLQMGPAASLLREADPEVRPAVVQSLRAALEPYRTDDGVCLGSAAWIVTARPV